MRKPYIYDGELGDLNLEIEQGLDLSNISDASSDSEAPREAYWRPASPDYGLESNEREDNEDDMRSERDTKEHRKTLALQLVAQDLILALHRRRRRRDDYWRFREGRPRTPEPSQGPRPLAPFDQDDPDGLDQFAHILFTDHVFLGDNNLTAHEQSMLAPEIARKLAFLRSKAAWQKRQGRRNWRRVDRKWTVLSRVDGWVECQKRKYSHKNNPYERDEDIVSERALTPRVIWQRRDLLLNHKSEDSDIHFTRAFLQNISVESFYGIYLLLPQQKRELFIMSGFPLGLVRRPRWSPAWKLNDPDYLEWQKFNTLKNLEVHRRRTEEHPDFDAWTERLKMMDRRHEQNRRKKIPAAQTISPVQASVKRKEELQTMGTSILTRESLRAYHQQSTEDSELHDGSHTPRGGQFAARPTEAEATGVLSGRITKDKMRSTRITQSRPKDASQTRTSKEVINPHDPCSMQ